MQNQRQCLYYVRLALALSLPQLTFLDRACWEQNADVANEAVLVKVLNTGGFDGAALLSKANGPETKQELRNLTAEAKRLGLCGVPTYRVLRQSSDGAWEHVGGLVWGQDELNVVEDLIAGWSVDDITRLAVPRITTAGGQEKAARL